ncbi:Ig-like domain-containing protein [Ekhidna sp.]|uniref:Ig-like domain-containing protein n=1 Tax=Ekhidna sp. TaxID=2608089 RepID=UPI003C79D8B7
MKTLIKISFIALLLAMLAACGEDKDSPAPNDVDDEEEVDTTAPTVVSISPGDEDTEIGIDAHIEITFSEAIDINSVSDNTIQLGWSGSSAIGAEVIVSGNLMTIEPSSDLEGNTEYTLTLTTGITDLEGNGLAATFTSSFTTENLDNEAPVLQSFSIVDGAVNMSVSTGVVLDFSEALDENSLTGNIVLTHVRTAEVVDLSLEVDGGSVTVTPVDDLFGNSEYRLEVLTGIKDLAGNALESAKSIGFKTEMVPLNVLDVSPSHNMLEVEVDETTIRITFDREINPASVDENKLIIEERSLSSPVIVSGTVSVNGSEISFVADEPWKEFDQHYQIKIGAGIEDYNGNYLMYAEASSFYTVTLSEYYYYHIVNSDDLQFGEGVALTASVPSKELIRTRPTVHTQKHWRFTKVGDQYVITNKYWGTDLPLEASSAGDGNKSFITGTPEGGGYFSGQLWDVAHFGSGIMGFYISNQGDAAWFDGSTFDVEFGSVTMDRRWEPARLDKIQ